MIFTLHRNGTAVYAQMKCLQKTTLQYIASVNIVLNTAMAVCIVPSCYIFPTVKKS